jgi:esterase/lipase superfamily enzyme
MQIVSMFSAVVSASTAVRLWSLISLIVSLFSTFGPSAIAQVSKAAAINKSIDAGLDSELPTRIPSGRLRYRYAFFITNRKIDPTAEGTARINHNVASYEDVFLNVPAVGASYGYALVSQPANRQRGDVSRGLNSTAQSPLYNFSVVDIQIVDSTEAFRDMIHRFYPDNNDKALLYIHGLDNTFGDAAETSVQLATDLRFGGPPLFLSWPSDVARLARTLPYTTILPNQYGQVKAVSIDTRSYAVLAIDELTNGVNRPFDLIARSMGTDIATNAIALREAGGRRNAPAIPHSVILAAPDISLSEFDSRLRPRIVRPDRRLVIYCSNDRALIMSKIYNSSDDRLGYCGPERSTSPPTQPMAGVDLVIVSGFISDFTRHSYYLESVKILDDIQAAFSDTPSSIVPVVGHRREIVLP